MISVLQVLVQQLVQQQTSITTISMAWRKFHLRIFNIKEHASTIQISPHQLKTQLHSLYAPPIQISPHQDSIAFFTLDDLLTNTWITVPTPCIHRSIEYSPRKVVFPQPVVPLKSVSSPGRKPLNRLFIWANRLHWKYTLPISTLLTNKKYNKTASECLSCLFNPSLLINDI